jgi:small subunit ribosomal protein S15
MIQQKRCTKTVCNQWRKKYMVKMDKGSIIKKFARSERDTGSCEVQIGLITIRITQISQHLEKFPKDKHSRAGLLKLVGKRRSLSRYLKEHNKEAYDNVMHMTKNILTI